MLWGRGITPHITALGDAGARFSNYHTSPLCAPTEHVLTGVDNHLTGVGTIPEVVTPAKADLVIRCVLAGNKTIADKLTAVGYRTYMTGNGISAAKEKLLDQHGFEESLFLMHHADNWEEKSYMPYYGEIPRYENGLARACQKTFIPPSSLLTR